MKKFKALLIPVLIGIVFYLLWSFVVWDFTWVTTAATTTTNYRAVFVIVWVAFSIVGEIVYFTTRNEN